MSQDLPYALIAWIKKNQEDIENHRKKMVLKNWDDDCNEYMKYVAVILSNWKTLKLKDKLFITSLADHHIQHRNFSPKQRSAIASMYMKYL